MGQIKVFSVLFLICLRIHTASGSIGTTKINCASGGNIDIGSIQEEYEGTVEIITNIGPDDRLVLEPHYFPVSVSFLELLYSDGDDTATVRTSKALDADALSESGGKLYYSITCTNTKMKNLRSLQAIDINDNPPVFQSKSYSATVSETVSVGSDVLMVKAEDADVSPENNKVKYSINPPVAEFEVKDNGAIKLSKRLNYNTAKQHTFIVEAKDIGNLFDTTTVTITVEDYDNLNPYFHHSLYKGFIEENQIGTFSSITPEHIKAQDGDTGINEPVLYSITGVLPAEYRPHFDIDLNTGMVSVTSALDREEIDQITVYIQAAQQDDVDKMANAVVFVTIDDVDDNPPKFDQDQYRVEIPENSPQNQFVLQTRVMDPDLGGFSGTLRIIPDSVPFSISPDGIVRVKNSNELDRETTSSFRFQVEAEEKPPSTNVVTAEVHIDLLDQNDNSPQFTTSSYEGKVYSNQTVEMLVVQVEATDLDEGSNAEISYIIDFGNEEGFFDINKNDGKISLAKTIPLVENKILTFSLYVTAKDGGAISRSTASLVNIKAPGDSRPQFLQNIYRGQVEEEQAEADVVKVEFLSIDPIVPVKLTVESEADKFAIDQISGVLSTKVKLDFEENTIYTVHLSISDGENRDEASVLIDVLDINDNCPVFETIPGSATVSEGAEVGDDVILVKATDADSGFNGEVRYTLQGSAGKFRVDLKAGLITVDAEIDRETEDTYHLVITAEDQGRPSCSTTTSLNISVTDINDNAPVFSKQHYEVEVSEHAEVGTDVLEVKASDKDEGPNGMVTYHIVKEPDSTTTAFTVDATSGSIFLVDPLDYSRTKKYTLLVEGRDEGSPSLTGSTVVTIWVDDVNDKAPVFSKDLYEVEVYENLAGGTALVSVEVTDEDERGFSEGSFILKSDTFLINAQGVVSLRTNGTLDREIKDNYIMEVIAVDQPIDGLSSTAQVKISVLDINDNNPQFVDFPKLVEIKEGDYTPLVPGEVCIISATDLDIGDNGRIAITTLSNIERFSIGEDDHLLAVEELDRERQDMYEVVIAAVDHGVPQGNNVTTLKIRITDINDNAPVFSTSTYKKSILIKDAKVGDLLLTLSATDADDGDNSIISFSFSEDSPWVVIEPETGNIVLISDLSEVTEDIELRLTVTATDHGSPVQSAEAEVLLYFRVASLSETVVFESSSYTFSIKENDPEATTVGQVKALTGSQLITVSYSLRKHTNVFSVNDKGVIKALRPLDKEQEEWYILPIEATDSRTPPTTAETMVSVQVDNVNEAPVFDAEQYQAEVFSISPFKFPVVKVHATDPDVGETSELQYALLKHDSLDISVMLEVEQSSGQLYVLDLSSVGETTVTCQVKAIDKHRLSATTTIQIKVKESESDTITVITLNKPVFAVEQKIPQIQESMKNILKWTVNILYVRAENGIETRVLEEATAKTYISFIATEGGGSVVKAKEVEEKLKNEHLALTSELEKIFGPHLELEVEIDSENSGESSQVMVIVLGVLLAISIMGCIAALVAFLVKFQKMKSIIESDSEDLSFASSKPTLGVRRKSEDTEVGKSETSRSAQHTSAL